MNRINALLLYGLALTIVGMFGIVLAFSLSGFPPAQQPLSQWTGWKVTVLVAVLAYPLTNSRNRLN